MTIALRNPRLPFPVVSGVTLDSGRTLSRSIAASRPMGERRALAHAFSTRLVAAWWRALTVGDDTSQALRPLLQVCDLIALAESAANLADDLGEAAATLDAEYAAYQIGMIYTGMLPAEHRGDFGVYYTPPNLAARLIVQATAAGVDWRLARVLDPACGGGAFLTPVTRRIIEALPGCSPAILIENIGARLRGYEIDPFAAWLSQVSLDAIVLPVSRAAGRRLPLVVTVCDSLQREPVPEGFDLVIGNPPYGRVSLNTADRARYRRGLYGHANLYGLFTDMALRHAKADGVIAYITPTSFLAGHYFKNLRALLARDSPPLSFDFVSARKGVFEDVLQETLLTTYRLGAASIGATVHEITPTDETTLTIVDAGVIRLPPEPSQPWILPRTAREAPLVARLGRMSHRLADWGYGVSTGPLVWNRHKDQLVDRPGRGRRPLIWAEAVTPDGVFMFRADKKNHSPYFELHRGDDWLCVDTPCVLLQRTTAKEQARRLIAACLTSSFLQAHGGSVVVENHLNMVKPIGPAPSISVEVMATFLNSAAADRVFRCVSGSVAVSAYELEALPLPPPESLASLKHLVEIGAKRHLIEAECTELYAETKT